MAARRLGNAFELSISRSRREEKQCAGEMPQRSFARLRSSGTSSSESARVAVFARVRAAVQHAALPVDEDVLASAEGGLPPVPRRSPDRPVRCRVSAQASPCRTSPLPKVSRRAAGAGPCSLDAAQRNPGLGAWVPPQPCPCARTETRILLRFIRATPLATAQLSGAQALRDGNLAIRSAVAHTGSARRNQSANNTPQRLLALLRSSGTSVAAGAQIEWIGIGVGALHTGLDVAVGV